MNSARFTYVLLCFDSYTAQKLKFSIEKFFSKCDQIYRNMRIWSHLLRKSLTEHFSFCTLLNLVKEEEYCPSYKDYFFEKELTFLWRSKKVCSVRMLCLFLVYMRKQEMHISIGVHLSFSPPLNLLKFFKILTFTVA